MVINLITLPSFFLKSCVVARRLYGFTVTTLDRPIPLGQVVTEEMIFVCLLLRDCLLQFIVARMDNFYFMFEKNLLPLIYVLSNGRKCYELLRRYSFVCTVQNTYAWIDIRWQKLNSVHLHLICTIQYKT